MNRNFLDENNLLIKSFMEEYDILTGKAVSALEKAKEIHQMIEALYIPNMDFEKLNTMTERIYAELSEYNFAVSKAQDVLLYYR